MHNNITLCLLYTYSHLLRTSFFLNLLLVPKIWRINGGTFGHIDWAIIIYTKYDLSNFMISSTSLADLGRKVMHCGIPFSPNGSTIPITCFVTGSNVILFTVPEPSSDRKTDMSGCAFGLIFNWLFTRWFFNSSHLNSPSIIVFLSVCKWLTEKADKKHS